MKYIMGIDQGSSKTHVIIGDDKGNVLGLGKGYGACHSSSSLEYALNAIRQAADIAFTQSKISCKQLSVVYAGMTGIDWDHEAVLLKDELIKIFGVEETYVVNDSIIAMQAGTEKDYGAILCAGSGLNCAIRKPNGEQFIYGFYIDDEFQGGSALGRACVRSVIDSEVGLCEPTILKDMVLKYFELKNVDELLYRRATNQITLQQHLYIPIILEEAASKNDTVAKDILSRFGRQFGRYVTCGLKKLDMLDMEVDVVLSGSIFKCKEPQLKDAVYNILKQEAPLAKIVDAEYEPIVGAYILGASKIHSTSEEFYNSIKNSSERFELTRA